MLMVHDLAVKFPAVRLASDIDSQQRNSKTVSLLDHTFSSVIKMCKAS